MTFLIRKNYHLWKG